MTTWLRSLAQTCCALLVCCDAIVGVHDLAISPEDAGVEESVPDVTTQNADASNVDSSPEADASTPKKDRGDGASEDQETRESGADGKADAVDGPVLDGDATSPMDGQTDDGTSSIDAGEAGRPADAGTDDGAQLEAEAGGLPDTGMDGTP